MTMGGNRVWTARKLADVVDRAYNWPDETITVYVGVQSMDHRADCRGQYLSCRAGWVPYWPHRAVVSVTYRSATDSLHIQGHER